MPPKKEEKKKVDHFPEVMLFLMLLLMIGAISARIDYAGAYWHLFSPHALWAEIVDFLVNGFWPVWKVIAVFIVIGSSAWIIYSWRKFEVISAEEAAVFGSGHAEHSAVSEQKKNDRWQRVLTHIASPNSAEWRLAVIEADVMLDELLRVQGYHGDSIGDRLKSVDPSDFLTLDAAWEAHKVRNQIAHAGADYDLNLRDAERVVRLYESVFREFQVI